MLNLFSTTSDEAGFRLQYMEVYNWGTFTDRIFRIQPQGNNSLLTGANASGKSTFIDALLTLLVPAKKDRFYNQSSGVDKKGDRTEETYVLGNYAHIQRDGDLGTITKSLRDKWTYSIILAHFDNINDGLDDDEEKYANPRNLASGTLSLDAKNLDIVKERNLTFNALLLCILKIPSFPGGIE